MRYLRRDSDPNLASYILDELRELRKGQEGYNIEIRGEFAAIRDTIQTLSAGVKVTQSTTGAMREDIEQLTKRQGALEDDVARIKRDSEIREVASSSSWNGPKRIIAVAAAGGMFVGALVTIIKGWPLIVELLAATTLT